MLADSPGFVPWFRRDLRHWRWMAWMAAWVLWGAGALIWEWAPVQRVMAVLVIAYVGDIVFRYFAMRDR